MDPWVQSFGRGVNKTSAAILPPSRGLCSSSFHPFLPSPAPLSLYLTLHSFLLLADIGCLPPNIFFSPFTHIHAAPHPSWISAKHYSLQNSAHPGVCQRSRWGPLFQFFFIFFLRATTVWHLLPPAVGQMSVDQKNAAAHTVRNI